MENIKYSVLIPVYNVEIYLRKCIESVLQQTYQNFEVILIDDGSTDLSGEICNEFAKKDSRIKYFSQENNGLIITRRKALSKSTGDFYLFLDSDDYWEKNLLETVNKVIISQQCDLVLFKYKRFVKEEQYIGSNNIDFKINSIFYEENKEKLFEEILSSSKLNNLVCKVVKKTILDDTDYEKYKNIKSAEDLLQSLPLLYNSEKIVLIDNKLYNYRCSPNSITQSFNVNRFNDFTTVRKILLDYTKKLKIDNYKNLELFYRFYIKSTLNYVEDLMNSSISNNEKKIIILKVKNELLYKNAIKYYLNSNYSKKHRDIKILLDNECYKILYAYVKLVKILRSLKLKRNI